VISILKLLWPVIKKATVTVCNMMLMEVLGFRRYKWLISINRIVTSNNNTV
jgi:hypothetical protein